jgi:hypothetical protein
MNIERFGYKFPYLLFYANFPSLGYQNRLVDRVKFTDFFRLNAPGSRGGLQGLNPRIDEALTLQGVVSNRIDSTGLESVGQNCHLAIKQKRSRLGLEITESKKPEAFPIGQFSSESYHCT